MTQTIEGPTLEACVARHAAEAPGRVAVVDGDERVSYAQLLALANERRWALGEVQGRMVPLRASSSVQFLAHYLAIHMAGGVAVPLDGGLPHEAFARHKADAAATVVPEGTADVLYTTGTTGHQKGVVVSHRALMANAANLVEAQGYGAGLTFVVCGPLNHIGSLSKVWATLAAGGTLCLVDGMKNMDIFFRAVEAAAGPVATFLVPASIRMLMTFAAPRLQACGGKMAFVETGAAPMAAADMQRLCMLLPHSRLYNTYASTETGIVATYNYNDAECAAGCVGRAMRHSAFDVTGDGLVVCRGATLMTGYLGDAEATRRVLHDGALHTADRGSIDARGRLHLLGRNDDVLNIGGFKVAPTEVEDAAMAFPLVTECVCTAVAHPVLGMALKLIVVAAGTFRSRDLALFLKARLEPHKVPVVYEQVAEIRRTFNGKVDRKSYR